MSFSCRPSARLPGAARGGALAADRKIQLGFGEIARIRCTFCSSRSAEAPQRQDPGKSRRRPSLSRSSQIAIHAAPA